MKVEIIDSLFLSCELPNKRYYNSMDKSKRNVEINLTQFFIMLSPSEVPNKILMPSTKPGPISCQRIFVLSFDRPGSQTTYFRISFKRWDSNSDMGNEEGTLESFGKPDSRVYKVIGKYRGWP